MKLDKLYTIGSRAPKYMQGTGKNKPIYLFTEYLVRFNRAATAIYIVMLCV